MRVFYVLVGVLTLVACIGYMAPATLLPAVLGDEGPIRLTQARGRVWDGTAAVGYQGHALGSLAWQFDATALLRGETKVDWRLASTGHRLSGSALIGFTGLKCTAAGTVRGETMRRILAPYWIEAAGDIGIERISAAVTYAPHLQNLTGELSWNGGEVRYRLAREHSSMVLPPLTGVLESVDAQPTLVVFAQGVDAPILHIRLGTDGWLTIGVTKKLTKMAGFPWPGNEPDHAIVIDVSERLI